MARDSGSAALHRSVERALRVLAHYAGARERPAGRAARLTHIRTAPVRLSGRGKATKMG